MKTYAKATTHPNWLGAACVGQQALFYTPDGMEPVDERIARERAAKAICARCPIRQRCHDWAVVNGEEHGIWGGRTIDEIRAAQRPRKAAS